SRPLPVPPRVPPPDFKLNHPEPAPETRSFPNFVPPTPASPIPSWPRATEPPRPVSMIQADPDPKPEPARIDLPPAKPVPLLEVPLRILGVIGKLYVVLESDRGLVLLDQHAAHERVLFEQ